MVYLYFFTILLIKGNEIMHQCHSAIQNFGTNACNNFYDYVISCPNNILQNLNLSNAKKINSIYILNTTNVTFSCSPQNPKLDKTKLIIYDNPIISFSDNCNINFVKIYGSPTFHTSPKAHINTVILYNRSYNLHFIPENLIYYHHKSQKYMKSDYYNEKNENFYYKCDFLKFSLSSNVGVVCGNRTFNLQYMDLLDYTFHLNTDYINHYIYFVNSDVKIDQIEGNMAVVMLTISLFNPTDVYFTDFTNISILESYINMFKATNSNIRFNITYDKYTYRNKACLWDDEVYSSLSKDKKDIINNVIKSNNWRKTCVNNESYLYLQDDTDYDLVVFSTAESWAIIIACISAFAAIIIGCLFVALCNYKFCSNKFKQ